MTAYEWIKAKVRQQQAQQEAQLRKRWEEVNCLWENCCNAEGLDSAAEFGAFSRDNPYLSVYQQAIAAYIGLRTEAMAHLSGRTR